jgi:N-acetylneuraminic acid mutarotase
VRALWACSAASAIAWIALAGCTADPTAIELAVQIDPSWKLDHYELRLGQVHADAEPLDKLRLVVPDGVAGQEADLKLWALSDGQQVAYGTAKVTPVAHDTVSVTIAPITLSCGMYCVEGTVECMSDGTSTCELGDDGCLAWSDPKHCPFATPYCSNGSCAVACGDECMSGQTECDSADAVRLCGNYDSDSCLDWSAPIACGNGETCNNGACGAVQACSPNGSACDDGNPCTNDTCANGVCVGTPKCTSAPADADPVCAADGGCSFKCQTYFLASGVACVPAPVAGPSTGRFNPAAVAGADGLIYVIGGLSVTGTVTLASVEAYDRTKNTWTSRTPMHYARSSFPAVATPDGHIYVFGGDGYGTVEMYDPVVDRWIVRAPMLTPRDHAGAALGPDGLIYTFGGINPSGTQRSVESYSPALDKWTALQDMSGPLEDAGVVAGTDGKLYVIGGQYTGTISSVVKSYDTSAHAWTSRPALPAGVFAAGVTVRGNGSIYVIGGNTGTSYTAKVLRLAPGGTSWVVRAPMPTAASGLVAVSLGPLIYAIGATTSGGVPAYSPAGDVW